MAADGAAPAAATAADSAAEAKILAQVEFYFGDSNLPRDRFLSDLVKKSEGGWVPIATLTTFKRLAAITKDTAVIAAALRKSESLLEVSEDGTKVRRKAAVPGDINWNARTIYVKGLPADSSIESVSALFAPHGKVLSVRLRHTRGAQRVFKGSAFVEFPDEAAAKEVVARQVKVGDAALLLLHKPEWAERQKAKRRAGGRRGKAAQDKDKEEDENVTSDEEGEAGGAKAAASADSPSKRGRKRKADGEAGAGGGEGEGDAGGGEKKEKKEGEFEKNLIVRLEGLAGASRESIKAAFESQQLHISYVDYNRGNAEGYVRLEKGQNAEEAVKKMNAAAAKVGDAVPTLRVLSGEEEAAYWKHVQQRIAEARATNKRRRK